MPVGHLKSVLVPSPNDFSDSKWKDRLEGKVDVRQFMTWLFLELE